MAKTVHAMIRVLNEERSVRFYKDAFGLEVADRSHYESFTLVYLRNAEADFELELMLNHGRSETYQLGDGYGHIAFLVHDLRAKHARSTGLDLSPTLVKEVNHEAQVLARFPFVQDPDGHKVEVLQRQGRYQ